MNITKILTKLKDANMISPTEEGMSLFSDCFNKFGISLLLLNDEDSFTSILNVLKENEIPLQKQNGIYALRIFAVELEEINQIVSNFKDIGELDFLRTYPEKIAESHNIRCIYEQIKTCQDEGTAYKNESGYDLDLLLSNSKNISFSALENISLKSCLKKHLINPTLFERLENQVGSSEEDVNVALELQKAENFICEEYLLPIEDGWKIVIQNKEVNSLQTIKDTINTITQLNLPVNYHDALLLSLFYKTSLSAEEVEDIIVNELFKEER